MGTLIAPLTNPRPLSIRPLPFYPDCEFSELFDERLLHESPSTSAHFTSAFLPMFLTLEDAHFAYKSEPTDYFAHCEYFEYVLS
jgi:hypothetical protein